MKARMSCREMLVKASAVVVFGLIAGCTVTTNYSPPAGVPTANIRFRQISVGGFRLYHPPALPSCFVPSDPRGSDPIGFASIPLPNDKTIVLIPSHRIQPRLGMPIGDAFPDGSYFELKMQADQTLTLWVETAGVTGSSETATAFRFTPRAGENYEVTVNFALPFDVYVHHIISRNGEYSEEQVKDLDIIRRCL